MALPKARDPIYRRRRFESDTIELCVRWYVTYRLSYWDQVAMMAERGIRVSHTTVLRWVIRYVPEFEKRWNQCGLQVCAGGLGNTQSADTNDKQQDF
jgi:transposase-like protein